MTTVHALQAIAASYLCYNDKHPRYTLRAAAFALHRFLDSCVCMNAARHIQLKFQFEANLILCPSYALNPSLS